MTKEYFDMPKDYDRVKHLPMFDEEGNLTDRVTFGLENVLHWYVDLASIHAEKSDNNPKNYQITQVLLVGSGSARNEIYSDLDLLLITPFLDRPSRDAMQTFLSRIFYCNQNSKIDAVDPYVREKDIYPDRASTDITFRVRDLLQEYNLKLEDRF